MDTKEIYQGFICAFWLSFSFYEDTHSLEKHHWSPHHYRLDQRLSFQLPTEGLCQGEHVRVLLSLFTVHLNLGWMIFKYAYNMSVVGLLQKTNAASLAHTKVLPEWCHISQLEINEANLFKLWKSLNAWDSSGLQGECLWKYRICFQQMLTATLSS